ncbi:hypothetical protein AVEN_90814-1 [Araneus ventricosus]|uniref:Uncharacterized protein n=1 Tax=Araneus ventricosus TaxID=182803 RepID=A0A4Y2M1F5_ARAVE|nr:hypothetical protein AVEN_90814-1 [Araneus ventricosus]
MRAAMLSGGKRDYGASSAVIQQPKILLPLCRMPPNVHFLKASFKYYFKLNSISNHPLRGQHTGNFFGRLYDARPSRHVRPFHSRIKRLLYVMHLGDFQTAGVFHYPPWKVPSVKLIGLFDEFRKNDTSSIILQHIFLTPL